MSTAFERIMRARGDLDCLHEPFMYDYYINRSTRQMPHFDAMDEHPKSYEAIRDMILAKAEDGPGVLQGHELLRHAAHPRPMTHSSTA